MAKSLDQLFEFLLEEIALDGEQGITIKDLIRIVKRFYAEPDVSPSSTSLPFPAVNPSIDRRFVSRLWYWLSQSDDISIGEDCEFNHLSLDEIEIQYPGILVNSDLDTNPSTARIENEVQQDAAPQKEEDGPRIRASEELVYYAIAGHAPDPTRIFPSEYALLCRIAAARYDGILQGILRQSTGQDKRSVPKRTDALQAKGYIVKKSVWTGGHKTSRLFLRRFAHSYPTSDTGQPRKVRLRDVASQIFSALKDNSLLTQDDLASHLEVSTVPAISVLDQLLRHFIRKGCLKKVKSAFAPGSKSDDLKLCFQIAREPCDQDWTMDDIVNLDLDISFDDAIAAAKQGGEAEIRLSNETLPDEEDMQISTRTPMPNHRPAWNPDRLMSNVLDDLASTFGDTGFTNMIARQEITGLFVRRPLEALLVRLSHFALKSAPNTVKNIAIVRRHELDDGIAHYVHRTLTTYKEMVKRGEAEWSSLQGGKEFAEQLQRTSSGDLFELCQEDNHGFIQRAPPKNQIRDGAVDMEGLISSIPAATFKVRGGDPTLVETGSGPSRFYTIQRRAVNRQRRPSTPTSPLVKKRKTNFNTPTFQNPNAPKRHGRNRKFTQGTWEFWREIFYAVRLQQDPAFPRDGTRYMSDPMALELFKERPPTMDGCILQSLQNQLPIPFQPRDISQQWIDKIHAFSHRTDPGVYLTPTGMRGYKRPPVKSKIMVVRSHRLKELDFIDRGDPPLVFFISSSAAHTVRNYRFASWWNRISENRLAEILVLTESTLPQMKLSQRTVTADVIPPVSTPALTPASTPTPISKNPPQKGYFRENSLAFQIRSTPLRNNDHLDLRPTPSTVNVGSDTDATLTDPETSQRQVQAQRQQRTKRLREKANSKDVVKRTSLVLSTGRSGRRRKLTQKAIESAQVLNLDLQYDASSPPRDVAELSAEATHDLSQIPSRQTMTPTPTPSTDTNLQLANPAMNDNACTELINVSGNVSEGYRVGQDESGFSVRRQEYPSNSRVVTLHISPPKLARFFSNAMQQERSLEICPEPMIPITRSGPTVSNSDLQQVTQEPSTTASDVVNDAVQQWAAQVPGVDENAVTVSSDRAVSESVLPEAETRSKRRGTSRSSSRTHENSRATSIAEDTNHGHDAQSAGANHTSPAIKRKTHRVVKSTVSTPTKKTQPLPSPDTPHYLESRNATSYYKRFLMDLVRMCEGVVPYQPSTLKRVMQPKCIEANIESNPNIKNVKSQIEQLVNTNRLKIMGFGFQRRGMSYTKKILALPNVQGTDSQFIELRDKMAALPYEDDYVPPELEAEAARIPSSRRWRQDSEEAFEDNAGSTPKRKQKQTSRRGSARAMTARFSFTPEPQTLSPNIGFLTLKISKERLKCLHLGAGFTSHYFRLPAVPLQFETDASKVSSATAAPTPVSKRRSGIRIPRNTKFSSAIGKIEWRTPKLTALPRTIKSILTQERQKQGIEKTTNTGWSLGDFEDEVDLVSSWEQRKWNDLHEPKAGEWIFIRYSVPKQQFLPLNVGDDATFRMIEFDQNGEEVELDPPEVVSWEIFKSALYTTMSKRKRAAETLEHRKRKFDEIDGRDGEDASDYEARTPRRRHPRTTTARKKRKVVTEKDSREERGTKMEVRGVGMKYLTTEQIHRLSVAIVVIRTLLGGLERHLDLHLLARLFPDEPLTLLRERWKVISARFMSDIDALGQDFQIKYLDALADERVPSVDFDSFDSTDWEGILNWALLNISKDGSKDSMFEIPPTRDELFTLNDLEVEESAPIRNLYTQSLVYAVPAREAARCSVVFGNVLRTRSSARSDQIHPVFSHEDDELDLSKARARSWVLAAVLTPNQSFDPVRAHAKLLRLGKTKQHCESLIESVLKKLQSDKIVVKSSNVDAEVNIDGKTYSGTHGWKVCSKFFDRLDSQRNISPIMLRRAAKYKFDVIDVAFAQDGTLSITRDADVQDGDMVAILNLLSLGMLQIKPGSDVPASRYGLDWERQEYKTKSMDKNLLSFTTVLEPNANYAYGDPLLDTRQNVLVPRGGVDQDDGLGLIPAWFDIHHDFRPEIWELILGAVVGLVSARPGISDIEITRTLGWALPLRDIDMVLQFLLNCRCIQDVYTGWETTEWWWLAIGAGYENGVRWNFENWV